MQTPFQKPIDPIITVTRNSHNYVLSFTLGTALIAGGIGYAVALYLSSPPPPLPISVPCTPEPTLIASQIDEALATYSDQFNTELYLKFPPSV